MSKQYKKIMYNGKLTSFEVANTDDLEIINEEVPISDQLGFAQVQLFKNNVRELAEALPDVVEYYVATSSGGAVTTKLTFTDGILTAVT